MQEPEGTQITAIDAAGSPDVIEGKVCETLADEVTNPEGLNLFRLVTTVITLIIGAGIFTLVGDMAAAGANTGAVLVSWVISLVGVFCLMLCFFGLSRVKPELKGGIYSYASAGFGDYMGFNSAWGYWISALLTPVSYTVLLFSTLSTFAPFIPFMSVFGDGNNLPSLIGATIVVWFYVFLVLRGIKEVTGVNAVITISKIVPIITAIIAIVAAQKFDMGIFLQNFWGEPGGPGFFEQVSSTLIVTIWVFIGIEGAVAISGRARKSSDVGRATIISFVCVFIIYLLVSILSMGVMPRAELAALPNPSLAGVLEYAVGSWGGILVSCGLVLSLAGAMLGYMVLSSETPHEAATEGVFPKVFAKVNKKGAPIVTLLITAGVMQLFLILMLFSSATYQFFYHVSVGMILIPYVLSSAYFMMLAFKREGFAGHLSSPVWKWKLAGVVGLVYSLFLVYSTGFAGIIITAILYAPGAFVYVKGKRERGEPYFKKRSDKIILGVIVTLFVVAVIAVATGAVDIFG